MKRNKKWYEHAPEGVTENEEANILWDVMIQWEKEIKARKTDERSYAIIEITITGANTTRDPSCIKESFKLQIRFVEKRLGGAEKKR